MIVSLALKQWNESALILSGRHTAPCPTERQGFYNGKCQPVNYCTLTFADFEIKQY